MGDTMFSQEEIEKYTCAEAELARAVAHGERVESMGIEGKVISYIYEGKTYIAAIEVNP